MFPRRRSRASAPRPCVLKAPPLIPRVVSAPCESSAPAPPLSPCTPPPEPDDDDDDAEPVSAEPVENDLDLIPFANSFAYRCDLPPLPRSTRDKSVMHAMTAVRERQIEETFRGREDDARTCRANEYVPFSALCTPARAPKSVMDIDRHSELIVALRRANRENPKPLALFAPRDGTGPKLIHYSVARQLVAYDWCNVAGAHDAVERAARGLPPLEVRAAPLVRDAHKPPIGYVEVESFDGDDDEGAHANATSFWPGGVPPEEIVQALLPPPPPVRAAAVEMAVTATDAHESYAVSATPRDYAERPDPCGPETPRRKRLFSASPRRRTKLDSTTHLDTTPPDTRGKSRKRTRAAERMTRNSRNRSVPTASVACVAEAPTVVPGATQVRRVPLIGRLDDLGALGVPFDATSVTDPQIVSDSGKVASPVDNDAESIFAHTDPVFGAHCRDILAPPELSTLSCLDNPCCVDVSRFVPFSPPAFASATFLPADATAYLMSPLDFHVPAAR